MLRAIALAVIVSCVLAFLPVEPAAEPQAVKLINGIGLIDYSRKPDLKIGQWVKYRITGSSELGMVDDYTVTVLIAGEEKFWGEDCFWVETWTEPKGGTPSAVATLMSYGIFGDSLAVKNFQLFTRKTINQFNEDGTALQVVTKRNTSSLKGRNPLAESTWYIDTLGMEPATVERGTFNCRKVSLRQGIGSTTDIADSTLRTEVREERTIYMSSEVPLTGIVREDIDYDIKRKTWKIGNSQDSGPMRLMEHSTGSGHLIDFGVGLTPQVVPEVYRKKLAATSKPAPAKSAAPKKKTG